MSLANEMDSITFGARLKAYRKEQGCTLLDVQKLTGVSKDTIYNIETNKYEPSVAAVKSLEVFYKDLVHKDQQVIANRYHSARFKLYRKVSNLTIKDLSQISGVSVTTLYKLEQAQSATTLKTARVIEQALGYPLALHPEDPRNDYAELIPANHAARLAKIETGELQEEAIHIITRTIHTAATSGLTSVFFSHADYIKWKNHDVIKTLADLGYALEYAERGIYITW